MNTDYCVLQCTLCTSPWATTLLCSFTNQQKCNAKKLLYPMFTKYTKVHRSILSFFGGFGPSFYRTNLVIKLVKVIKNYVFMYISEVNDFRGQFLPRCLYSFFSKELVQCTSKRAKYTEVHWKGLIHARERV